ncbi:MAG: capsule assembly Wzi family protein [Ignavibacteriaceae bacterium]|nr:capsule assembly Wzi family protein [Ignavibacteriaceae bacterium]
MKNPVAVLFTLTLLLFISPGLSGQIIYAPLNSSVYDFLDRMNNKEIIDYYAIIKPIPRKDIAGYLKVIASKRDELTALEKQELDFYNIEFSKELTNEDKSWHIFSYSDTLFRLFVTPIVGLEGGSLGGKKYYKTSWLGRFDGSISDNIGFSYMLTDNSERGDTVDKDKKLSPLTGFNYKYFSDGHIEYENINAIMSYNWSWGIFSIGKDFQNWGSGRFGQLILSSKAPSFPFFKLDVYPAKWLKFSFIHGWLNSDVPDSIYFYPTTVTGLNGQPLYRAQNKSKFFAANMFSILPAKNLVVSFGNSVIYSDQGPSLPFLIPFIWYYKGIDHNFYGSTKDDGLGNNGQLFFDFNYVPYKGIKVYSTLFIDEFSFTGFLKGDHSRDQLGYTVGLTSYNSIVEGLLFELEYTKVMPGTYLNYIQTQTYANNSYNLGHWIGQNADLLDLGFTYYFSRGLNFKLLFEKLRKGGDQLGTDELLQKTLHFLYKPLISYNKFNLDVSYEFLYNLFIKGELSHSNYYFDTGNYNQTTNNWEYNFSIKYGM